MKKLIALLLALALQQAVVLAQTASPFNGTFKCEETGLMIHLDLDNESLEIPGMSFLGLSHGYLDGISNNHVYGVWMLIKHSVEGKKAKLRFTNDIGSDSQDIVLTLVNDSTLQYNATGNNVIRKVEGRKLVKTPSAMTLKRIKY